MDSLRKYLNLHALHQFLVIAWISFTLASPKLPTHNFLFLVLQGGQGCGKTLLCKILQMLIDPCIIGVRTMPKNIKDLAIAVQGHLVCFDNISRISKELSDLLCIIATGGAYCPRQLYTDDSQSVHILHAGVVINGISNFIHYSDLSQRCIQIEMLPFDEMNRKSEADFIQEFQNDLPKIQGELFNLIAEIFKHLPNIKVIHPERMYAFVQWLAAMEMAQGVPAGVYQSAYSDAVKTGQLDTLIDNVLASTVLDFAESLGGKPWSGSPTQCLAELDAQTSFRTQRSRGWPQNPIALSLRLQSLQAGLLTQGVNVQFTRGKHRIITITTKDNKDEY